MHSKHTKKTSSTSKQTKPLSTTKRRSPSTSPKSSHRHHIYTSKLQPFFNSSSSSPILSISASSQPTYLNASLSQPFFRQLGLRRIFSTQQRTFMRFFIKKTEDPTTTKETKEELSRLSTLFSGWGSKSSPSSNIIPISPVQSEISPSEISPSEVLPPPKNNKMIKKKQTSTTAPELPPSVSSLKSFFSPKNSPYPRSSAINLNSIVPNFPSKKKVKKEKKPSSSHHPSLNLSPPQQDDKIQSQTSSNYHYDTHFFRLIRRGLNRFKPASLSPSTFYFKFRQRSRIQGSSSKQSQLSRSSSSSSPFYPHPFLLHYVSRTAPLPSHLQNLQQTKQSPLSQLPQENVSQKDSHKDKTQVPILPNSEPVVDIQQAATIINNLVQYPPLFREYHSPYHKIPYFPEQFQDLTQPFVSFPHWEPSTTLPTPWFLPPAPMSRRLYIEPLTELRTGLSSMQLTLKIDHDATNRTFQSLFMDSLPSATTPTKHQTSTEQQIYPSIIEDDNNDSTEITQTSHPTINFQQIADSLELLLRYKAWLLPGDVFTFKVTSIPDEPGKFRFFFPTRFPLSLIHPELMLYEKLLAQLHTHSNLIEMNDTDDLNILRNVAYINNQGQVTLESDGKAHPRALQSLQLLSENTHQITNQSQSQNNSSANSSTPSATSSTPSATSSTPSSTLFPSNHTHITQIIQDVKLKVLQLYPDAVWTSPLSPVSQNSPTTPPPSQTKSSTPSPSTIPATDTTSENVTQIATPIPIPSFHHLLKNGISPELLTAPNAPQFILTHTQTYNRIPPPFQHDLVTSTSPHSLPPLTFRTPLSHKSNLFSSTLPTQAPLTKSNSSPSTVFFTSQELHELNQRKKKSARATLHDSPYKLNGCNDILSFQKHFGIDSLSLSFALSISSCSEEKEKGKQNQLTMTKYERGLSSSIEALDSPEIIDGIHKHAQFTQKMISDTFAYFFSPIFYSHGRMLPWMSESKLAEIDNDISVTNQSNSSTDNSKSIFPSVPSFTPPLSIVESIALLTRRTLLEPDEFTTNSYVSELLDTIATQQRGEAIPPTTMHKIFDAPLLGDPFVNPPSADTVLSIHDTDVINQVKPLQAKLDAFQTNLISLKRLHARQTSLQSNQSNQSNQMTIVPILTEQEPTTLALENQIQIVQKNIKLVQNSLDTLLREYNIDSRSRRAFGLSFRLESLLEHVTLNPDSPYTPAYFDPYDFTHNHDETVKYPIQSTQNQDLSLSNRHSHTRIGSKRLYLSNLGLISTKTKLDPLLVILSNEQPATHLPPSTYLIPRALSLPIDYTTPIGVWIQTLFINFAYQEPKFIKLMKKLRNSAATSPLRETSRHVAIHQQIQATLTNLLHNPAVKSHAIHAHFLRKFPHSTLLPFLLQTMHQSTGVINLKYQPVALSISEALKLTIVLSKMNKMIPISHAPKLSIQSRTLLAHLLSLQNQSKHHPTSHNFVDYLSQHVASSLRLPPNSRTNKSSNSSKIISIPFQLDSHFNPIDLLVELQKTSSGQKFLQSMTSPNALGPDEHKVMSKLSHNINHANESTLPQYVVDSNSTVEKKKKNTKQLSSLFNASTNINNLLTLGMSPDPGTIEGFSTKLSFLESLDYLIARTGVVSSNPRPLHAIIHKTTIDRSNQKGPPGHIWEIKGTDNYAFQCGTELSLFNQILPNGFTSASTPEFDNSTPYAQSLSIIFNQKQKVLNSLSYQPLFDVLDAIKDMMEFDIPNEPIDHKNTSSLSQIQPSDAKLLPLPTLPTLPSSPQSSTTHKISPANLHQNASTLTNNSRTSEHTNLLQNNVPFMVNELGQLKRLKFPHHINPQSFTLDDIDTIITYLDEIGFLEQYPLLKQYTSPDNTLSTTQYFVHDQQTAWNQDPNSIIQNKPLKKLPLSNKDQFIQDAVAVIIKNQHLLFDIKSIFNTQLDLSRQFLHPHQIAQIDQKKLENALPTIQFKNLIPIALPVSPTYAQQLHEMGHFLTLPIDGQLHENDSIESDKARLNTKKEHSTTLFQDLTSTPTFIPLTTIAPTYKLTPALFLRTSQLIRAEATAFQMSIFDKVVHQTQTNAFLQHIRHHPVDKFSSQLDQKVAHALLIQSGHVLSSFTHHLSHDQSTDTLPDQGVQKTQFSPRDIRQGDSVQQRPYIKSVKRAIQTNSEYVPLTQTKQQHPYLSRFVFQSSLYDTLPFSKTSAVNPQDHRENSKKSSPLQSHANTLATHQSHATQTAPLNTALETLSLPPLSKSKRFKLVYDIISQLPSQFDICNQFLALFSGQKVSFNLIHPNGRRLRNDFLQGKPVPTLVDQTLQEVSQSALDSTGALYLTEDNPIIYALAMLTGAEPSTFVSHVKSISGMDFALKNAEATTSSLLQAQTKYQKQLDEKTKQHQHLKFDTVLDSTPLPSLDHALVSPQPSIIYTQLFPFAIQLDRVLNDDEFLHLRALLAVQFAHKDHTIVTLATDTQSFVPPKKNFGGKKQTFFDDLEIQSSSPTFLTQSAYDPIISHYLTFCVDFNLHPPQDIIVPIVTHAIKYSLFPSDVLSDVCSFFHLSHIYNEQLLSEFVTNSNHLPSLLQRIRSFTTMQTLPDMYSLPFETHNTYTILAGTKASNDSRHSSKDATLFMMQNAIWLQQSTFSNDVKASSPAFYHDRIKGFNTVLDIVRSHHGVQIREKKQSQLSTLTHLFSKILYLPPFQHRLRLTTSKQTRPFGHTNISNVHMHDGLPTTDSIDIVLGDDFAASLHENEKVGSSVHFMPFALSSLHHQHVLNKFITSIDGIEHINREIDQFYCSRESLLQQTFVTSPIVNAYIKSHTLNNIREDNLNTSSTFGTPAPATGSFHRSSLIDYDSLLNPSNPQTDQTRYSLDILEQIIATTIQMNKTMLNITASNQQDHGLILSVVPVFTVLGRMVATPVTPSPSPSPSPSTSPNPPNPSKLHKKILASPLLALNPTILCEFVDLLLSFNHPLLLQRFIQQLTPFHINSTVIDDILSNPILSATFSRSLHDNIDTELRSTYVNNINQAESFAQQVSSLQSYHYIMNDIIVDANESRLPRNMSHIISKLRTGALTEQQIIQHPTGYRHIPVEALRYEISKDLHGSKDLRNSQNPHGQIKAQPHTNNDHKADNLTTSSPSPSPFSPPPSLSSTLPLPSPQKISTLLKQFNIPSSWSVLNNLNDYALRSQIDTSLSLDEQLFKASPTTILSGLPLAHSPSERINPRFNAGLRTAYHKLLYSATPLDKLSSYNYAPGLSQNSILTSESAQKLRFHYYWLLSSSLFVRNPCDIPDYHRFLSSDQQRQFSRDVGQKSTDINYAAYFNQSSNVSLDVRYFLDPRASTKVFEPKALVSHFAPEGHRAYATKQAPSSLHSILLNMLQRTPTNLGSDWSNANATGKQQHFDNISPHTLINIHRAHLSPHKAHSSTQLNPSTKLHPSTKKNKKVRKTSHTSNTPLMVHSNSKSQMAASPPLPLLHTTKVLQTALTMPSHLYDNDNTLIHSQTQAHVYNEHQNGSMTTDSEELDSILQNRGILNKKVGILEHIPSAQSIAQNTFLHGLQTRTTSKAIGLAVDNILQIPSIASPAKVEDVNQFPQISPKDLVLATEQQHFGVESLISQKLSNLHSSSIYDSLFHHLDTTLPYASTFDGYNDQIYTSADKNFNIVLQHTLQRLVSANQHHIVMNILAHITATKQSLAEQQQISTVLQKAIKKQTDYPKSTKWSLATFDAISNASLSIIKQYQNNLYTQFLKTRATSSTSPLLPSSSTSPSSVSSSGVNNTPKSKQTQDPTINQVKFDPPRDRTGVLPSLGPFTAIQTPLLKSYFIDRRLQFSERFLSSEYTLLLAGLHTLLDKPFLLESSQLKFDHDHDHTLDHHAPAPLYTHFAAILLKSQSKISPTSIQLDQPLYQTVELLRQSLDHSEQHIHTDVPDVRDISSHKGSTHTLSHASKKGGTQGSTPLINESNSSIDSHNEHVDSKVRTGVNSTDSNGQVGVGVSTDALIFNTFSTLSMALLNDKYDIALKAIAMLSTEGNYNSPLLDKLLIQLHQHISDHPLSVDHQLPKHGASTLFRSKFNQALCKHLTNNNNISTSKNIVYDFTSLRSPALSIVELLTRFTIDRVKFNSLNRPKWLDHENPPLYLQNPVLDSSNSNFDMHTLKHDLSSASSIKYGQELDTLNVKLQNGDSTLLQEINQEKIQFNMSSPQIGDRNAIVPSQSTIYAGKISSHLLSPSSPPIDAPLENLDEFDATLSYNNIGFGMVHKYSRYQDETGLDEFTQISPHIHSSKLPSSTPSAPAPASSSGHYMYSASQRSLDSNQLLASLLHPETTSAFTINEDPFHHQGIKSNKIFSTIPPPTPTTSTISSTISSTLRQSMFPPQIDDPVQFDEFSNEINIDMDSHVFKKKTIDFTPIRLPVRHVIQPAASDDNLLSGSSESNANVSNKTHNDPNVNASSFSPHSLARATHSMNNSIVAVNPFTISLQDEHQTKLALIDPIQQDDIDKHRLHLSQAAEQLQIDHNNYTQQKFATPLFQQLMTNSVDTLQQNIFTAVQSYHILLLPVAKVIDVAIQSGALPYVIHNHHMISDYTVPHHFSTTTAAVTMSRTSTFDDSDDDSDDFEELPTSGASTSTLEQQSKPLTQFSSSQNTLSMLEKSRHRRVQEYAALSGYVSEQFKKSIALHKASKPRQTGEKQSLSRNVSKFTLIYPFFSTFDQTDIYKTSTGASLLDTTADSSSATPINDIAAQYILPIESQIELSETFFQTHLLVQSRLSRWQKRLHSVALQNYDILTDEFGIEGKLRPPSISHPSHLPYAIRRHKFYESVSKLYTTSVLRPFSSPTLSSIQVANEITQNELQSLGQSTIHNSLVSAHVENFLHKEFFSGLNNLKARQNIAHVNEAAHVAIQQNLLNHSITHNYPIPTTIPYTFSQEVTNESLILFSIAKSAIHDIVSSPKFISFLKTAAEEQAIFVTNSTHSTNNNADGFRQEFKNMITYANLSNDSTHQQLTKELWNQALSKPLSGLPPFEVIYPIFPMEIIKINSHAPFYSFDFTPGKITHNYNTISQYVKEQLLSSSFSPAFKLAISTSFNNLLHFVSPTPSGTIDSAQHFSPSNPTHRALFSNLVDQIISNIIIPPKHSLPNTDKYQKINSNIDNFAFKLPISNSVGCTQPSLNAISAILTDGVIALSIASYPDALKLGVEERASHPDKNQINTISMSRILFKSSVFRSYLSTVSNISNLHYSQAQIHELRQQQAQDKSKSSSSTPPPKLGGSYNQNLLQKQANMNDRDNIDKNESRFTQQQQQQQQQHNSSLLPGVNYRKYCDSFSQETLPLIANSLLDTFPGNWSSSSLSSSSTSSTSSKKSLAQKSPPYQALSSLNKSSLTHLIALHHSASSSLSQISTPQFLFKTQRQLLSMAIKDATRQYTEEECAEMMSFISHCVSSIPISSTTSQSQSTSSSTLSTSLLQSQDDISVLPILQLLPIFLTYASTTPHISTKYLTSFLDHALSSLLTTITPHAQNHNDVLPIVTNEHKEQRLVIILGVLANAMTIPLYNSSLQTMRNEEDTNTTPNKHSQTQTQTQSLESHYYLPSPTILFDIMSQIYQLTPSVSISSSSTSLLHTIEQTLKLYDLNTPSTSTSISLDLNPTVSAYPLAEAFGRLIKKTLPTLTISQKQELYYNWTQFMISSHQDHAPSHNNNNGSKIVQNALHEAIKHPHIIKQPQNQQHFALQLGLMLFQSMSTK